MDPTTTCSDAEKQEMKFCDVPGFYCSVQASKTYKVQTIVNGIETILRPFASSTVLTSLILSHQAYSMHIIMTSFAPTRSSVKFVHQDSIARPHLKCTNALGAISAATVILIPLNALGEFLTARFVRPPFLACISAATAHTLTFSAGRGRA